MNSTLIRAFAPDPRHRPDAIAERILPAELRRGRGAATNLSGRFESERREAFDDGWTRDEAPEPLLTEVTWEKPKAIIARNESPAGAIEAGPIGVAKLPRRVPFGFHGNWRAA